MPVSMLFTSAEPKATIYVSHSGKAYYVKVMYEGTKPDGTVENATANFKVDSTEWGLAEDKFYDFLINNGFPNELYYQVSEYRAKDVADLLLQVTNVFDYGINSGLDVYFRGTDKPFRLKDDNYVNPKDFNVWYVGTFGEPVDIDQSDWIPFVAQLVKKAEHRQIDPIGIPVIDEVIDTLLLAQIHTMFCDDIAEYITVKGEGTYAVLQMDQYHNGDRLIFLPKFAIEKIYTKLRVSRKKIRQYISPFLYTQDEVFKRAGKDARNARYWIFSYEKLFSYNPDIANILDTIIDCAAEKSEVTQKNG